MCVGIMLDVNAEYDAVDAVILISIRHDDPRDDCEVVRPALHTAQAFHFHHLHR